MSYSTLLYNVSDNIATITLNRPKRLNALSGEMLAELLTVVRAADRDADVRCIILTGAGRAFSAGADLNPDGLSTNSVYLSDSLRATYNQIVNAMLNAKTPIIGAVNGVAAGAGCGIILATDMRIAAESASFLQAFTRIGLIPDSGSAWFLPRMIGYARAFEMIMAAEPVPATKALDWGLVNYVVPNDQLAQIARSWASRLANGPSVAYGLAKQAINYGMNHSLNDTLEMEAMLQDEAAKSDDFREGVTAFLEKRKAKFSGK